MRNLNFKTCASISSLAALLATLATAGAGCSTGSDTSTGTAGTTGSAGTGAGTAGTTGSAGTGAGTAGTTGAAGTGAGTGAAGVTGEAGTGAAGTGLPATTGVCAGAATRKLELDQSKVENFEDGAVISPGWSTFNDVEVGGMKNTIKMTLEAPGAVGTGHAAHYMGMGAKTATTGGYGVGTIYNAAIDKTNNIYCVDVQAFDGVTFWAKGKAGTHLGVNFVVPQTNMTPDGDCTTSCYNHPQKSVALTAEWQQYSVTFSSAVAGTAKVNGRIQQLGWLSPEADWDFYIDEIQFYKGTAPTTPAM